jgi:elongation factor Ts
VGVTVEDIKKLREVTGAGMMDAKKALVEADGNFDGAIDALRKAGAAKAVKKADREARNGLIETYIHTGKIGALVEINCETDFVARTDDFKEFAHDVAMQVAATNPEYVNPDDIPENVLDKEKSFYREELDGQKKPAEMVEKIIAGKLEKYYEGVCLTRQPFVKDSDKTINQLTTELIAKLGENIVIRRFSRMELGEVNG